jgi:integrase/recombinase XerD
MEYLTPQEIERLLTIARKRSARAWAMLLLSYKHALRPSECCGLGVADVDLIAGCIRIGRLKNGNPNRQEITGHRGKPLLDEYLALRAWLKERGDDASPFLFTSQKSKRIDRTQWFREFQRLCDEAGIDADRAHPHTLRHSLATHMVEKHADLLEIKQRLGHKSIQSTMIYSHIGDRQADAAARRVLSEIF